MSSPVLFLIMSSAMVAVASAAGANLERQSALMQLWEGTLNGHASNAASKRAGLRDTPVTRVVGLLKEMQTTLGKEMDEDEALYDKLTCWCNTNEHEKSESLAEAQAKIADLGSTASALTAKTSELSLSIKQLDEDVAAGKQALEAAAAMREKDASQFHGTELETIQAVQNLQAAIEVLSRHVGAALPQIAFTLPTASFLAVRGRGRKGKGPWGGERESRLARSFDEFLEQHGFTDPVPTAHLQPEALKPAFVGTRTSVSTASADWSSEETAVIQRALRSASAFMQSKHDEEYYPSYSARSGEIVGLLKELKEQMAADLSEAQKTEISRKAAFEELRASKRAEVDAAEKQAEQKEDELAKGSMDLANTKEDISQTEASVAAEQQFLATLTDTCENADANFEARKTARLAEITAVGETITILSGDEARDTMSRTFSLLQQNSDSQHVQRKSASKAAAAVLTSAAARVNSPSLSILATQVELDSFSRVKKAIDGMVAMLKKQQEDEVKKRDWCTSELHENEVATTKTEDLKADLSSKIEDIGGDAQKFGEEEDQASHQIAQMQVELQRASENRQKENHDFQSTIADQFATQAVLKQAIERLAKYYESAEFVQTRNATSQNAQAPPVPEMEYKASAGGNSAISLIEKIIQDAKGLQAEARAGEAKAQAEYEAFVGSTNVAVSTLAKEVIFKTSAKAGASKEKMEMEGDLSDTVGELEGLDKYKGELYSECNYLMKNFDLRQEARGQEVEALNQAKQILSGAAES